MTGTNAKFNWNYQLRECSIEAKTGGFIEYGVITFPVLDCQMMFSQDLVQHKYPNVRSANIEATGANPHIFKIRAPFVFGLQHANGESWGTLFPDVFQQVLNVLTDDISPTIEFIHPTLGIFTVKAASGNSVTTSEIRNGQVLEFELIETRHTGIVEQDIFSSAESAANVFDTQVIYLNPAPPSNVTSIGFTQLLQQIRALIDTTSLSINQISMKINNAIYQVNQVQTSLKGLKSASTSNLQIQLETMKAGLLSLKNGFAQQKNTLAVFIVPTAMTLSQVALEVQNNIEQIIRLNPAVAYSPTIPNGTVITYQQTNNTILGS